VERTRREEKDAAAQLAAARGAAGAAAAAAAAGGVATSAEDTRRLQLGVTAVSITPQKRAAQLQLELQWHASPGTTA
jgi:hypothetical protein